MKTTTKLNNIQLLRAFAAVAVVVFHTGFAFPSMRPFGSFGVDVFFVISGYIMARILDPASDSSSDFFFRRRVLRIVPPYWFFTLLLFLASLCIPQLMGSTRADGFDLVRSLLFIPFTKGSGLIQPLLFIGWSLNYEMYFYLTLAIGLLIYKRYAVWIGSFLVIAVMLVSAHFAAQSVAAQFYSREIVLEFILGILSYYLCRAFPDHVARRIRWPSLIVCIAAALQLIAIQGIFPPLRPHLPLERVLTLGIPSFLLVVSASLLSQGKWDTKFASLVLIGDASYILYLVHPYCEYSIGRTLGKYHDWLKLDSVWRALILVTVSILVAVLIHLYAEGPAVRFLNRNFGGKRKSVEFITPAA
ncbi:acyltransferase family protein [Acidicapsa ligni]|uniref:acyltransferase family protein n=1 Tax=Acidicapsa ligni TaxID=542300 RepID=UPI0021DFF4CD|nr:acyltransferase [Acidicapsa ligni]